MHCGIIIQNIIFGGRAIRGGVLCLWDETHVDTYKLPERPRNPETKRPTNLDPFRYLEIPALTD